MPKPITPTVLLDTYRGFNLLFEQSRDAAPSQYGPLVSDVPSSTKENIYPWLKNLPGFREWVGDRVVHQLESDGFRIPNKSYENTVGVDRDDIEDDTLGVYNPLFAEMGRQTAEFPDTIVFDLLPSGFDTPCYDGQYFFDTDHPVLDSMGEPVSVSNSGGGAGPAWYLMDLSRAIKPIIYQRRRSFDMTRMDAPTDELVFNRKEYRYGVDGRCGCGFGMWQLAYGSKQELNQENYAAARQAMLSLKRDYGKPMGIRPTHLVVPPALEGAALEILSAERNAAGATNVYRNTAQLMMVPWLA